MGFIGDEVQGTLLLTDCDFVCRQIEELAGRITLLAAEDAKQPPLPSGVGDAVMKAFALPPSRLVGEIKKQLEAAIASGEIAPHLESEAYVELIAKDKARFGIGS